MSQRQSPGLFGLVNSNRDFTDAKNWGKNVFNNAFPVALACYMYERGIEPIYLHLNAEVEITKSKIRTDEFFGTNPLSESIYFAFERDFAPYQRFVIGSLPRTDLVTMDKTSSESLRPLEIKLTMLLANSSH